MYSLRSSWKGSCLQQPHCWDGYYCLRKAYGKKKHCFFQTSFLRTTGKKQRNYFIEPSSWTPWILIICSSQRDLQPNNSRHCGEALQIVRTRVFFRNRTSEKPNSSEMSKISKSLKGLLLDKGKNKAIKASSHTWSQLEGNKHRHGADGVVWNNVMYIIGGSNEMGVFSKEIMCYDLRKYLNMLRSMLSSIVYLYLRLIYSFPLLVTSKWSQLNYFNNYYIFLSWFQTL